MCKNHPVFSSSQGKVIGSNQQYFFSCTRKCEITIIKRKCSRGAACWINLQAESYGINVIAEGEAQPERIPVGIVEWPGTILAELYDFAAHFYWKNKGEKCHMKGQKKALWKQGSQSYPMSIKKLLVYGRSVTVPV